MFHKTESTSGICFIPVYQVYFQEILLHKGGLDKSDQTYHGSRCFQTNLDLGRLVFRLSFTTGIISIARNVVFLSKVPA